MSKQATVTLTIRGGKEGGIEEHNEIAKWLRMQADWFLINAAHKKLSNRVTLRLHLNKENQNGNCS